MMINIVRAVIAATFLISLDAAAAGSEARPLLSLQQTAAHEVVAKPARYNGFDGLHVVADPDHKTIDEGGCDNCTILVVEGIDFRNGTIEIEVAGKPQPGAPAGGRGFVGVVFRVDQSTSHYEGIYLRPVNSTEKVQIRRNHTVQYFSQPDHYWRKLRKEHPGVYESWADVVTGEWTRMRIDVDGARAVLYLNGSDKPTLIVDDLKLGADARGTIGLFTEPATDAYFRNLIVTHR